jgi:multiple sugar transport system substrate-binding protein
MTKEKKVKGISRRDFIKAAGAGAVAAGFGANIIIPGRAIAGRKKLKILHFGFPRSFAKWFDNTAKEWGEKNGTEVIVDYESVKFLQNAVNEVKAQKGHDIHFLPGCAAFEEHVIDHREIYQECEKRYGKAIPLAIKSTYNPKTGKYLGFCESYTPDPINYRKDLWDGVGMYPNTWEDVGVGGAKIKKKYGIPVGIGLSKEYDSNLALRAILYSYGASVQDEEGNVVINSKQTLEAVKFVRGLFKEAMTPEVLEWDIMSNNRFMLGGKGSLVVNAISITRDAEKDKVMAEISKKIWLAKPPAGPVRRIGLPHGRIIHGIWKFADNIEGAKRFLVDYIGDFRKGFLASEFFNFPCFPDTVPDLEKLIANDPKADPPDKYKVLANAQEWTTNGSSL